MIQSINDFQRPFFIGIAGAGMSAIAQYLKGIVNRPFSMEGRQQDGAISRYFRSAKR